MSGEMNLRRYPAMADAYLSVVPDYRSKSCPLTVGGRDMELIESWLEWMQSGSVAPSTIRMRRYQLQAFQKSHSPLVEVKEDDVLAYLARPGRGADAKHSILSGLRSFYKWALVRGHIDHDPTALCRSIPIPPRVPKPVPEAVLARALAKADPETRTMLLLGAYAGLRRAEIARLHEDDITSKGLVVRGKGGRRRYVPMHPILAPELAGVHGWVFPSPVSKGLPVSPDYVASRVEAVLEGHTCHSLRHRFGTRTYEATHDLRVVQELMGHASPTTTAMYTLIADDKLQAAILAVA